MRTVAKQDRQDRLRSLEREVARYRSFIISLAGEDAEGVYRPEFVVRLLAAANERPTKAFRNASRFLSELNDV